MEYLGYKVGDKVILLPTLDEIRKEVFKDGNPKILLPCLDFNIKRHFLTIQRFEFDYSSTTCVVLKGGKLKDNDWLDKYLIPIEAIKHPSLIDNMKIKLPYLYV